MRRSTLLALLWIATVAPAMAAPLQWRLLGPAAGGGRVAAVAGSDADPMLHYFGAAGGGVFKRPTAD